MFPSEKATPVASARTMDTIRSKDHFAVDLKDLWGFPRSALPPSNWHLFKSSEGVIRCRYEQ